MFGLNQWGFKIKFLQEQFNGETYIANAVCISTFGLILGLVSIHRATGSWKNVFSFVLKFPPLIFLPIFGFVTFGATSKGKAKSNNQKLIFSRRRLGDELELDLGQLCCLPLYQQDEILI